MKMIIEGFLALLLSQENVMITQTTVDIHLHDTYYVLDLEFLAYFFALIETMFWF